MSSNLSIANYHSQRGAIALAGILILLMMLLLSALVVDSGRLWLQQKQLQSVADLSAMHAARHLGCDPDLQDVIEMAQTAAVNNGFVGQLSSGPNLVLLGRLNTVQGIRQFIADGSHEAIYIRATREVPGSLMAGGLFGGTVTLQAEAVSVSDPPLATFSVGSFAAGINSQQSLLLNGLLGKMLGGSLNLDALSYQGIAATSVTLQDLLAVSGDVGGLEGLLKTNLQIGELLDLFANAAGQSGLADIKALAAMQTVAHIAVNKATLTLGDVLKVSTPDSSTAARVNLNALSLITTAAMIANGSNAINLPLGINIPLLASINAQVIISEPPQLAIGPAAGNGAVCTVARTAQVKTRVAVLVNIPLLASIDLALGVEVAQGSAGLRSIEQQDGETEVTIDANPGIAALTLTNNAGTGPARISTLLNIPLADIGLNLPLQPGSSQTLEYTVDNPVKVNLPQTQVAYSPLGSSLANALSQSDTITIKLLGVLDLGLVNTVLSTIVSPLLAEIGRVLLDPLLNLLGIRLGGLEVTLEDLQYRQAKPLVI